MGLGGDIGADWNAEMLVPHCGYVCRNPGFRTYYPIVDKARVKLWLVFQSETTRWKKFNQDTWGESPPLTRAISYDLNVLLKASKYFFSSLFLTSKRRDPSC